MATTPPTPASYSATVIGQQHIVFIPCSQFFMDFPEEMEMFIRNRRGCGPATIGEILLAIKPQIESYFSYYIRECLAYKFNLHSFPNFPHLTSIIVTEIPVTTRSMDLEAHERDVQERAEYENAYEWK